MIEKKSLVFLPYQKAIKKNKKSQSTDIGNVEASAGIFGGSQLNNQGTLRTSSVIHGDGAICT